MMPVYTILKAAGQLLVISLLLLSFAVPVAQAANSPQKGDGVQVMETFERQTSKVEDANIFNDHKKHVIMFLMGVPLIILVLITGALGIAMVVYGKQVFVMHMVFAGLTITLAIAHVIVGMVWFYPF